jgi:hypothetical protein
MSCTTLTDAYWLPLELHIQLYYSIEKCLKHAGIDLEICFSSIVYLWEKPYMSEYIEKTIVSTFQSYIDRQDEQHREMDIRKLASNAGNMEVNVSRGWLNASMEVIKNLQDMVLSRATSPEHKAELEELIAWGRSS